MHGEGSRKVHSHRVVGYARDGVQGKGGPSDGSQVCCLRFKAELITLGTSLHGYWFTFSTALIALMLLFKSKIACMHDPESVSSMLNEA
jgi:hypothetical protein